ncbi:hypothetical protein PInf_019072 [Phytophthora infestans]|nr:hypothetical protein PInf_019072 [Phytophthora infestans]
MYRRLRHWRHLWRQYVCVVAVDGAELYMKQHRKLAPAALTHVARGAATTGGAFSVPVVAIGALMAFPTDVEVDAELREAKDGALRKTIEEF